VNGEILGALVATRDICWNTQFGHRAVCVEDDGPLPVRELAGGLRLTVLGGWCRTAASGVWPARLAVHRAPWVR
jgi:hypothetical protein